MNFSCLIIKHMNWLISLKFFRCHYLDITIQSFALTFECINYISSCHCFSSSVFSIGNSISNNSFKETFKNLSSVIIDK